MLVVGGPSGSGKSRMFPVASSGYAHFNIDDRCRALHGSYVAIPDHVRTQAQQDCEAFVAAQIANRRSFAVETTLRSTAAIRQAETARAGDFVTQLVYIATSDVTLNIERVALRALDGGHSAPPARLREIYDTSLRNLPAALAVFDVVHLYDGSGEQPLYVAGFFGGACVDLASPVPSWLQQVFARRQELER